MTPSDETFVWLFPIYWKASTCSLLVSGVWFLPVIRICAFAGWFKKAAGKGSRWPTGLIDGRRLDALFADVRQVLVARFRFIFEFGVKDTTVRLDNLWGGWHTCKNTTPLKNKYRNLNFENILVLLKLRAGLTLPGYAIWTWIDLYRKWLFYIMMRTIT